MKGGLFPKDAAQAAQAQMIVLGAEDLFQAYWVSTAIILAP